MIGLAILVMAFMAVSFILGALWREEYLREENGTYLQSDYESYSSTIDFDDDISPLRKD